MSEASRPPLNCGYGPSSASEGVGRWRYSLYMSDSDPVVWLLEPLTASPHQISPRAGKERDHQAMATQSIQQQLHGPLTCQRLVDDFVNAVGAGDTVKVEQYLRGGIPIDKPHSVSRIDCRSSSVRVVMAAMDLDECGADTAL